MRRMMAPLTILLLFSQKLAVEGQKHRHAAHRQSWVGGREGPLGWPFGQDANHRTLGALGRSGAWPDNFFQGKVGEDSLANRAMGYLERKLGEQGFWSGLRPATGYARHHAGRRVCARLPANSISHYFRGQTRFIFAEHPLRFSCCPGWSQITRISFGCNRPICSPPCLNGGLCSAPGRCACPKGFFGAQCQKDVNECEAEKPCEQICTNLPGGYECACRPGYFLRSDERSCRQNDDDEDLAFEAKDLSKGFDEREGTTVERREPNSYGTENEPTDVDLDQDYEIIRKRLAKLQKLISRSL